MTPALMTRPSAPTASWPLELHGVDPATGYRATWHFLSVDVAEGEPARVRVERVDGDITHPAVWMQASKTVTEVPEAEVVALVHRVSGA